MNGGGDDRGGEGGNGVDEGVGGKRIMREGGCGG